VRRTLRIGACQTPELLEDVPAALAMVESFGAEAYAADLDLLLFPECFLQGCRGDRSGSPLTVGMVVAEVG
jgi:predicted amidohydrolase